MSVATEKAAEQAHAAEQLREILPPGSTAWTILRRAARSGMSRHISVAVPTTNTRTGKAEVEDITWLVARALGDKIHRDTGGIVVGGCGMDMGFHLVYSLAQVLYPEGFACIGEACPANDHTNGDRDYTPGHVVHRDGGYAIARRWL